jgi:hypothetical protein
MFEIEKTLPASNTLSECGQTVASKCLCKEEMLQRKVSEVRHVEAMPCLSIFHQHFLCNREKLSDILFTNSSAL